MRKPTAAALLAMMLASSAWAGLGSNKTLYVGGTLSGLKERTEGTSSTGANQFVFRYKGGSISIPYNQVSSLELAKKLVAAWEWLWPSLP